MNILITGGTGFIGRHLVEALLAQQHTVVLYCRHFPKARKLFDERVELVSSLDDIQIYIGAVFNLAGEPILGKRWTENRKKVLYYSRIGVTRRLVEWISQLDEKPHTFISGSAIGYYGNHPENVELDESGVTNDCFPSEICCAWEFEALKAKALGLRVCLVRTGVVLDKTGGALKKMWLPFSLGLGGEVGTGEQWLSWIHIEDMIYLLLFLLQQTDIDGPVNAVAPNPVRYRHFTRSLSKVLSRPHLFPMPTMLVELLLGESAQLLLEGQKVIPRVLQQADFSFEFSTIETALKHIADK